MFDVRVFATHLLWKWRVEPDGGKRSLPSEGWPEGQQPTREAERDCAVLHKAWEARPCGEPEAES